VAEASVKQAKAQLDISTVNLGYTDIRAPKDGIIIDRKIEPGQTVAAQFQTPELFEIGVGMREKMHINASVDENDIGMIRKAQETDQPVTFTVNAYPEELFHGKIVQIRMSATELQSVVTYPVIVEAPNPDLKLLPNMTADLSFKIDEHKNVLRVPNQAIRFLPDKKLVREEDQKVLDGSLWAKPSSDDDDDGDDSDRGLSAEKRTEAKKSRSRRHVWVKEGDKLRAIEVEVGMIDQEEGKTTEVINGDLEVGQELVIGIKKKKGGMFGG
jgi:HlyD family secretion protein